MAAIQCHSLKQCMHCSQLRTAEWTESHFLLALGPHSVIEILPYNFWINIFPVDYLIDYLLITRFIEAPDG